MTPPRNTRGESLPVIRDFFNAKSQTGTSSVLFICPSFHDVSISLSRSPLKVLTICNKEYGSSMHVHGESPRNGGTEYGCRAAGDIKWSTRDGSGLLSMKAGLTLRWSLGGSECTIAAAEGIGVFVDRRDTSRPDSGSRYADASPFRCELEVNGAFFEFKTGIRCHYVCPIEDVLRDSSIRDPAVFGVDSVRSPRAAFRVGTRIIANIWAVIGCEM